MAIFHASVKIIGRSAGRSIVAAAAYRSGECMTNDRDGVVHDYTKKRVEHSEIMAPETAPDWMRDRSALWNGVEAAEKRKDSQLAREIELALPRELSRAEQIELVRGFVQEKAVNHGMVADIAIHEPKAGDGETQPHAHILLTMRRIEGLVFGKKATEWNPDFVKKAGQARVADTSPLVDLRGAWAEHVNQALERASVAARVDHRSLDAQREAALKVAQDLAKPEPERQAAQQQADELDRAPQPKLGAAAAMERRGVKTRRGDDLRAVQAANAERATWVRKLREIGLQAVQKAKAWGAEWMQGKMQSAEPSRPAASGARDPLGSWRASAEKAMQGNDKIEIARAMGCLLKAEALQAAGQPLNNPAVILKAGEDAAMEYCRKQAGADGAQPQQTAPLIEKKPEIKPKIRRRDYGIEF